MTPPTRVLITGATGAAGWHLSELALAHGAEVFGVALSGNFVAGVSGQWADLTQPAAAEACIQGARADLIFHLAALIPSAQPTAPEAFVAANILGTHNVLEAARRFSPQARVLMASSSSIYGRPANPDHPISEAAPFQPQSLYGTTKATQELLALQFFWEHGLHTVRARTFNQTGPREAPNLVCATLARQIAQIEAGQQEPVLRVGALAPERDFSDVRDVVAAYWALLQSGVAGQAYNICSGQAVSIARVTELLLGLSRRPDIQVLETGPAPSPRAIHRQIGDAGALRACTGWQPRIALPQSLRDLLNEWRDRVAHGGSRP